MRFLNQKKLLLSGRCKRLKKKQTVLNIIQQNFIALMYTPNVKSDPLQTKRESVTISRDEWGHLVPSFIFFWLFPKFQSHFFLMHNVAHNQMYNIYYCNTLLNFYHVENYSLDLQLVISRNSECHLYIFIHLKISGYFCCCGLLFNRNTEKTLPFPYWDFTVILPFSFSKISLHKYSPIPDPSAFSTSLLR